MLDHSFCCIFIKWIIVKLYVTPSPVFLYELRICLYQQVSFCQFNLTIWQRLWDNCQRRSPGDCLCGVCGLVDVDVHASNQSSPSPEHTGIVRLQVFMMHWRWFGKSIPDPFTVQSLESALSLPHSGCSYSSWCLNDDSLLVILKEFDFHLFLIPHLTG